MNVDQNCNPDGRESPRRVAYPKSRGSVPQTHKSTNTEGGGAKKMGRFRVTSKAKGAVNQSMPNILVKTSTPSSSPHFQSRHTSSASKSKKRVPIPLLQREIYSQVSYQLLSVERQMHQIRTLLQQLRTVESTSSSSTCPSPTKPRSTSPSTPPSPSKPHSLPPQQQQQQQQQSHHHQPLPTRGSDSSLFMMLDPTQEMAAAAAAAAASTSASASAQHVSPRRSPTKNRTAITATTATTAATTSSNSTNSMSIPMALQNAASTAGAVAGPNLNSSVPNSTTSVPSSSTTLPPSPSPSLSLAEQIYQRILFYERENAELRKQNEALEKTKKKIKDTTK